MIFFLFEAAECGSLRFSETLSRAQALLLTELRKRFSIAHNRGEKRPRRPPWASQFCLVMSFFTHSISCSISRVFTLLQASCSATVFSLNHLYTATSVSRCLKELFEERTTCNAKCLRGGASKTRGTSQEILQEQNTDIVLII